MGCHFLLQGIFPTQGSNSGLPYCRWILYHLNHQGSTVTQSLLRLMSIESVILSNHLIFCCLLFLLLSIFPSIRVFSSEPALCIRGPMYWSFSLSISPSSEYSGLISFRIDWFDFLAVQVIFKILSSPTPQFKSINSLVLGLLYGPALTSIHDYWKNNSFDYTDFVGKMLSLLFNMLCGFVAAFLPRSKHLLISWLQSSSTGILEYRCKL